MDNEGTLPHGGVMFETAQDNVASSNVFDVLKSHSARCPPAGERAAWRITPMNFVGHNVKFVATDGVRTCGLIKVCDNTNGRVPDICRREELASVLGKMLGCVPVVDAWVIPLDGLQIPTLPTNRGNLVSDECVLMPLLSDCRTLEERQLEVRAVVGRHLSYIANILAFMHWLGDEDRGLADVMISDDRIVLIDNGLCGPGYSKRLRGTHPFDGHFRETDILKKCYPGKMNGFVEWVIRDAAMAQDRLRNPVVIDRIRDLSDNDIREVIAHVKMRPDVAKALIERRDSIAQDYSGWLDRAVDYFSGFDGSSRSLHASTPSPKG